jgi:hypothetical protein
VHVEQEYFRCGAWTCIAALEVHRTSVYGRCETKNGIAPSGSWAIAQRIAESMPRSA